LELPNKSRNVLQIIGITAVARLLLAAALGLGVDESYAVSVARPLSLGYFDHPPLHFWIAGAMTWLAGSPPAGPIADLIVRLPFVVLFALTTWLLYLTTARLFDSRAGLWAVIALNLSAVFTLSTASWVLPDGPLMCASMATVYCVVRALEGDRSLKWWIGAGLGGGCAMLSKYHGVFVLAGILLFLATTPEYRRWLLRPQPYMAAAIAALMFAPDLVWNSHHGWVSQSTRITWSPSPATSAAKSPMSCRGFGCRWSALSSARWSRADATQSDGSSPASRSSPSPCSHW
jgi:4-amino-4-deoxy-L-arabinose transferase-like glycosyltransferase